MSVVPVLRPADYESRLQRYLFERAEEGRAVRVGEKKCVYGIIEPPKTWTGRRK